MPLRTIEGHRAPPLLNNPAQGERRVAHGEGMVEGGQRLPEIGRGRFGLAGRLCHLVDDRPMLLMIGAETVGGAVPAASGRADSARCPASANARCWSIGKGAFCGKIANRQSACSASIPRLTLDPEQPRQIRHRVTPSSSRASHPSPAAATARAAMAWPTSWWQ